MANDLRWASVMLPAGTANYVLAAGSVCGFKAPAAANGGGVTIVEAFLASYAPGTLGASALTLYDMGTAGTAIAGTVGAIGTASLTWVAAVPKVGTITPYFLSADKYLGVSWPAGTIGPQTQVNIGYVLGR